MEYMFSIDNNTRDVIIMLLNFIVKSMSSLIRSEYFVYHIIRTTLKKIKIYYLLTDLNLRVNI